MTSFARILNSSHVLWVCMASNNRCWCQRISQLVIWPCVVLYFSLIPCSTEVHAFVLSNLQNSGRVRMEKQPKDGLSLEWYPACMSIFIWNFHAIKYLEHMLWSQLRLLDDDYIYVTDTFCDHYCLSNYINFSFSPSRFTVSLVLFCVGGFIYKTRAEGQVVYYSLLLIIHKCPFFFGLCPRVCTLFLVICLY